MFFVIHIIDGSILSINFYKIVIDNCKNNYTVIAISCALARKLSSQLKSCRYVWGVGEISSWLKFVDIFYKPFRTKPLEQTLLLMTVTIILHEYIQVFKTQ